MCNNSLGAAWEGLFDELLKSLGWLLFEIHSKWNESVLMYTLDFETIQQVMRAHQKTGYLYADVPAGTAGLSEPCRIEILLQTGVITSCSIVGRSGRRLPEKEALKKVARMGQLQWDFKPQEEIPGLSDAFFTPQEERAVFPRRIIYLDQAQIQSWPRLHRMVFALCDGTRSITKIAEMLSAVPEQVESALRDLQSIAAIVMGFRRKDDWL
jgi:hypothetical protein